MSGFSVDKGRACLGVFGAQTTWTGLAPEPSPAIKTNYHHSSANRTEVTLLRYAGLMPPSSTAPNCCEMQPRKIDPDSTYSRSMIIVGAEADGLGGQARL